MSRVIESWRLLLRLVAGRLRAFVLRLRGARLGPKTTVGSRFHVSTPWCLTTGERLMIEDDVYFKIDNPNAVLNLGDRVFIGRGCEFDVISKLNVGPDCLIAPGVFITDHNHGLDAKDRMNKQPCTVGAVCIGADVWIGTKVTILPGVTIGDGAVIGAHALVNRDVPDRAIVAGVPARLVGTRK